MEFKEVMRTDTSMKHQSVTWWSTISFLTFFVSMMAEGIILSVQWLGNVLDEQGSIPGRNNHAIFFSSPPLPDRLWDLPNGY